MWAELFHFKDKKCKIIIIIIIITSRTIVIFFREDSLESQIFGISDRFSEDASRKSELKCSRNVENKSMKDAALIRAPYQAINFELYLAYTQC